MDSPLVSVITPSMLSRRDLLDRCIDQVKEQDYPNVEHVIVHGDTTTGGKRNNCCEIAKGEIIIHFDDDDYYAPDWISRSVHALKENNADLVGLRKAYFYKPNSLLKLYERKAGQPYVLGATMCYKRSMWERNKFRDIKVAEDKYFCAAAGEIYAHDYHTGFMATIHGDNTSSQEAFKLMAAQNIELAKQILGINYDRFIQR